MKISGFSTLFAVTIALLSTYVVVAEEEVPMMDTTDAEVDQDERELTFGSYTGGTTYYSGHGGGHGGGHSYMGHGGGHGHGGTTHYQHQQQTVYYPPQQQTVYHPPQQQVVYHPPQQQIVYKPQPVQPVVQPVRQVFQPVVFRQPVRVGCSKSKGYCGGKMGRARK